MGRQRTLYEILEDHEVGIRRVKAALARVGSAGNTLTDLDDVTITAVTNDEVLQYTGAGWENQTLAEAGISAVGHTHSYLPLAGGTMTGDLALQDGINLSFLNSTPTEEWSLGVDASDHLVLSDPTGVRFEMLTFGGWRIHDEAENPVFQFVASSDRFRFQPAGTANVIDIYDAGLLTNYTQVVVPLSRFTDTGSFSPTITTDFETIGTITIAADQAHAYMMTAQGGAAVQQNTNTTHEDARLRLRWSTDGGSTWTSGPVFWAAGLASDEQPRNTMVALGGFENVSPTGTIQVQLQIRVSSTNVTVTGSGLTVELLGAF